MLSKRDKIPLVHFKWGMESIHRRKDSKCADIWSDSSPNSFAARFLYTDERGMEESYIAYFVYACFGIFLCTKLFTRDSHNCVFPSLSLSFSLSDFECLILLVVHSVDANYTATTFVCLTHELTQITFRGASIGRVEGVFFLDNQ